MLKACEGDADQHCEGEIQREGDEKTVIRLETVTESEEMKLGDDADNLSSQHPQ